MWSYVRRNSVSILRIYSQYEPLRVFMTAAALVFVLALVPWMRFFIAYIGGDGAGHVQSLIFGAVLFNASVVLAALGIIGDLLVRPARDERSGSSSACAASSCSSACRRRTTSPAPRADRRQPHDRRRRRPADRGPRGRPARDARR